MTAAGLVKALQARGVTLVADGETLRCRPKSALSDEELAALKAMKAEILATLRRPAPTRPVVRLTCFACKCHRFWISVRGDTICAVCHPPPDSSMVVAWVPADGATDA